MNLRAVCFLFLLGISAFTGNSRLTKSAAIAGRMQLCHTSQPRFAGWMVLPRLEVNGFHRAAADAGAAFGTVFVDFGIGADIRFKLFGDDNRGEPSRHSLFGYQSL